MLSLILPALAAAATPFVGLAWQPLSRADLLWVDEGRTSGVAVGEFDGVVDPPLQAFGGVWLSDDIGLVGSLGVARLQTTTVVGDTWRQQHWGVIRPAIDIRYAIGPREVGRPAPWATLGVHGDIPSARDVSNGYTDEEQAQADQEAFIDRARLGGVGARMGVGLDYRLREGIAIGGMYTIGWHRGLLRTDEADVVSSWVSGRAQLLVTFEWPGRDEGAPAE